MRAIPGKVTVLLIVLALSTAAIAGTSLSRGRGANGAGDRAAPDTAIVTRIAPVQQDYGVGSLESVITESSHCYMESEPVESRVSNLMGGQHFTWVIWNMTALPQDAEITGVEIEHELYPDSGNSEGTRLQYRSLESLYLSSFDCWAAYDELQASLLYLDVEMGLSSGTRRYALGDSAVADVAAAASDQGYFSIWITAAGYPPGSATVPGWSAGGPELIVSRRSEVEAENESWGAMKALFRK